jgi:hypothetical protein
MDRCETNSGANSDAAPAVPAVPAAPAAPVDPIPGVVRELEALGRTLETLDHGVGGNKNVYLFRFTRVAFSQLERVLLACKHLSAQRGVCVDALLGSCKREVVVSCRIRVDSGRAAAAQSAAAAAAAAITTTTTNNNKASKKRRRGEGEEDEEEVENAKAKMRTSVEALRARRTVANADVERASEVLLRLLLARSTDDCAIVTAFALTAKQLDAGGEPRAFLAAAANAGQSVCLKKLRTCFGPCWRDGQVCLTDEHDVRLPLSAEAELSAKFGNAPLKFYTAVPAVAAAATAATAERA